MAHAHSPPASLSSNLLNLDAGRAGVGNIDERVFLLYLDADIRTFFGGGNTIKGTTGA